MRLFFRSSSFFPPPQSSSPFFPSLRRRRKSRPDFLPPASLKVGVGSQLSWGGGRRWVRGRLGTGEGDVIHAGRVGRGVRKFEDPLPQAISPCKKHDGRRKWRKEEPEMSAQRNGRTYICFPVVQYENQGRFECIARKLELSPPSLYVTNHPF